MMCRPRRSVVAEQEAVAVGAVLTRPISLRDLEELLGLPVEERSKVLAAMGAARAFVTLPIGVSAAAVSVAVLFFG